MSLYNEWLEIIQGKIGIECQGDQQLKEPLSDSKKQDALLPRKVH